MRFSQSPLLASTPWVVDEDAPAAVRRATKDVCAVAAHLDRTAVGLRAFELPAVVDEGDDGAAARERDSLVERRADPSDGRASLVFLTERARSFHPVAKATLAEFDRLVVGTRSTRGRDEVQAALRMLADLCAAWPRRASSRGVQQLGGSLGPGQRAAFRNLGRTGAVDVITHRPGG
jgi:hypothetical protein